MATVLTMNKVSEIRKLIDEGETFFNLMKKYKLSWKRVFEITNNVTEREIYKLYYSGLTPKFISIKLGIDRDLVEWYFNEENEIEIIDEESAKRWLNCKTTKDSEYTWKKHRKEILEKGKKCCITKAEQEAKIARQLGNEIEAELSKYDILNQEVLERIADHLGYKDMLYFKKAMQICGVYDEELAGIFKKILKNNNTKVETII